ncbi:MAG: hypothetical protein ABI442_14285 [Gemmatimonadaceae bacterium]
MAQMTGEYPRPISPPAWLTARARNAVHRPVFIGAVGVGTFAIVLAALLLAPQQVRRASRRTPVTIDAPPDTAPLIAAMGQARARVAAAESSLAVARSHSGTVQVAPEVQDSAVAHRDTLSAAVNDLDALLTRVEGAPVTAAYRSLGESPQLSSNPRVKALLDSLGDIDRDREAFGSSGAADPVAVALTARATEIGRAIQAVAHDRRDALRDQIAKLATPMPRQIIAQTPGADTAAWIAARDSSSSLLGQATNVVAEARAKIKTHDQEVERAAADARVDVPPIALLGAALVFGIALGFGSAIARELRHPRISGDHEVERMTGARVLATVRPKPRLPDRTRRTADNDAPPYFDPAADGYQLTYLHVARAGASRLMLSVVGEETGLAAVVAANVAAIAADEARSTILIDTDSRTSPVAAVLQFHAEPGLADVMDRGLDWAEVVVQASVGRDRMIDVIPSGVSGAKRSGAYVAELLRRESARIARHYEAIIVVVSAESAKDGVSGSLPIPDAIVCARIGHTRIADLQATLADIRAGGGNPLGVVLWDAPPPALPSAEKLALTRRPRHPAEMQAIASSR